MSIAAPPCRSPLFTIKEAAALCRVCVRSIHRMIESRQLEATRIGGRVLVHRRDLERLIGPLGDVPESDA
jgi:excisionase family DNA binding protein